jgi:hypothetical protein
LLFYDWLFYGCWFRNPNIHSRDETEVDKVDLCENGQCLTKLMPISVPSEWKIGIGSSRVVLPTGFPETDAPPVNQASIAITRAHKSGALGEHGTKNIWRLHIKVKHLSKEAIPNSIFVSQCGTLF